MNDSLKKAFSLAKKTGDRVIVVDNDSETDAFVVMNIDEYEKILSYKETYSREIKGLTEDQLIDKINRDIALWKNEQQEEDGEIDIPEEDEILEEENMYYYSEPEWNYPFSYPEEDEKGELEGDKDEKEVNEPEEKESIFEKFNREQKEHSREKKDRKSKDWAGKNDWKIPFDVKAGADEVKE
jgi:hypothetical protein